MLRCPYCKRRISYFFAIFHKESGEYSCPKCKKECKVAIKKAAYVLFAFFLAAALLFMLIANGAGQLGFGSFVIVALPFVIYYLMIPTFLAFIPLKKYKKESKEPIRTVQSPQKMNEGYGVYGEYDGAEEIENIENENVGRNIDPRVFNRVREIRTKKFETMELDSFFGNSVEEKSHYEEDNSKRPYEKRRRWQDS